METPRPDSFMGGTEMADIGLTCAETRTKQVSVVAMGPRQGAQSLTAATIVGVESGCRCNLPPWSEAADFTGIGDPARLRGLAAMAEAANQNLVKRS